MEITRSRRIYEFRVLDAAFSIRGRTPQVGELVKFYDIIGMVEDLCSRGLIEPADCPEIGVYIVLKSFTLPGRKEKFKAEKLQRVELLKEDAIRLMFERSVIPVDNFQWRPYGLRLGKNEEKVEIPQKKRSFLWDW